MSAVPPTANTSASEARQPLPLAGLHVLEFGHTIMGPACGMVLADLGAEVIKIEPPGGDRTRNLKGFGSGYFGFFNRNKKSLAVDLKRPEGRAVIRRLLADTDVLVENFAPGMMARHDLDYEQLRGEYPGLIYCSLKGFLPGPYEDWPALDEVVQMMGGLAYMTGPSGRPLRAGASVVDIMGGNYGALAIVVALQQRQATGLGQLIQSALFETTAFLMGQHLAYAALSDAPIPPMPERVSAWSIYELFDIAGGEQVFIGITSDKQWQQFCAVFDLPDLQSDTRLATNNDRIAARPWLVPRLKQVFAALARSDAERLARKADIAFAPVARPESLFDDPQLNANGSLMPTKLPGNVETKLPLMPIRMNGQGFVLRSHPPRVGEHTAALLSALNYSAAEIAGLEESCIISCDKAGNPA
ncbi:CaiB/BaiF CoA transferase family protein [Ferrovibrio sp.]|uniref:CaiB/BaiF CoA transferase family protein n=1 Tax=Ferrovibrio sp. TaxID=1917215 RepID=UPI0035B1F2A1